MNELKDMYGIELTEKQLIIYLTYIFNNCYQTYKQSLEMCTDKELRIHTLCRIEAIQYAYKKIIGEEE